ncbi:RecQ family ATP-dependent DNA helicase [Ichthyobacterium seriolicida]|uniref:ATP-dependent DNA helicase RecQ n=1 Tax=Ichthyobacterium seriolicida TaxID=242600 RepID=A0A1J1E810_9FLAO|nr:RecQ family ATP-dependent DNA helicase [Ichthyobacterium seriolicida]BAV95478.1 ATP-dependent DNA helicase RecQ [Ichthyobacterium seriolicida]
MDIKQPVSLKQRIDLKLKLKDYFGFDSFNENQEEIITSLLDGNDVFVLMPTGGGKSMCFQLPALISEGTAIIISPLIALMKNQMDSIRSISERDGVVHVLNSLLSKSELEDVKRDIRNGVTKLVYISPESLTKQENIEFFKSVNISFFAVDEAHCISEWGHDFRPEYRTLKPITESIANVPIMVLTATATPKVQEDIQKNLGMDNAKVFKSSFNRPNLYYEVRHKSNTESQIVKFIHSKKGESGIIYCSSRKKVDEISELLNVNGITAVSYHAGLDAKTRAKNQDMFIMEDVDVVVATVAFGMGIDKPDVRYVIHHSMPKSLESYYQETGRAGRDGGEGHCLAFYDYEDMEKIERFLNKKSISEREVGLHLLQEVVSFCETSISRRKFLLHYFGEYFDEINGKGADMDDNARFKKKQIEVKDEIHLLLDAISKTFEQYKAKEIIYILMGKSNSVTKAHKVQLLDVYKKGEHRDEKFWKAACRQAIVRDLLKKNIEEYGKLKLTEKGRNFLTYKPSFTMAEDHDYTKASNTVSQKSNVGDKNLLIPLKSLRKEMSKKLGIPPFAIFQDSSLDDMCVQYPTTIKQLIGIYGVGEGKAKKFGEQFVNLISDYVKENDILRPDDIVVKSAVNKSVLKVYIIKNTDKKLLLEDIAKAKGISMDNLLSEIERIVNSGTNININYAIADILDEDQVEEIYDYFLNSEDDSIEKALKEFDGEYSEEEIRMVRIKFINEVAN